MRYFYIAWDMWDTRTITYGISITWGVKNFITCTWGICNKNVVWVFYFRGIFYFIYTCGIFTTLGSFITRGM